jgi:hypothetical protein
MSPEEWDTFVRRTLVEGWLEEYDAMTAWPAEVMEIPLGSLIYLFDGTPSMSRAGSGDDRVVAVWGHSVAAEASREKSRQAGFITVPEKWSHVGMDPAFRCARRSWRHGHELLTAGEGPQQRDH